MAEIVLTRPTGYRTDRLRAYRVLIDGQNVGELGDGDTKVFSLPSGRHELQLKLDWGSSEQLQVDLSDCNQAKFVCTPRVKEDGDSMTIGLKMIYSLTIGFRRYIDIRPEGQEPPMVEAGSKRARLNARTFFLVALATGIAFWLITGEIVVVAVVVVGGCSLVLAGLIARVVSRFAIQLTEKSQQHRKDE